MIRFLRQQYRLSLRAGFGPRSAHLSDGVLTMNRFEIDAHDALTAFEARQKRHAAGYPPRPRQPLRDTWAPKMTEQQKQELEQYIKDHNLPF